MNRWLSLTIFFLLFIFGTAEAHSQSVTSQSGKKVTVTLVRWPYT